MSWSCLTPYTSVVLAQGQLPSANDSQNLVNTISASSLLSINDLESLRANLEKCFSTPSTARGTPQAPTADCSDGKFVVSSDYTVADGFKHSSYAWNGSRYDSTHTSIFYSGLFGYMLTQSKYDNLKFLKPQIIRPLDTQGTTWAVKFPVQFSDGTIDQMGEVIRSQFMVVKKISSLASTTDNGIRFVGDQRDFQTFIVPVMQKIVNVVTGDYRYETGLNVQFTNQSSSTDPSHRKPVMGKLTGKGLPIGGVYFAQKLDGNGNGVCGNYLPVTSKSAITNNPDVNLSWSNVYTSYPCAGVFVMSIAYSGAYTNTTTNNARYLKWLGDDGNFGDLRETTFDSWWGNVGYELFREDRDFRRIAVHEVTEDLPDKSIAFIVPLDVSPATLKKQFDRLLAKHHPDYKKFDRWKASSAQQKLRKSKLTSQSLNLYLDVYECWIAMQRDNAQIRLYEVGEHMRLSPRYTVKDDDSDTIVRNKHLEMSLLVTEYLSKAKNLIAQASEGKFPCTENHHWIERSTRSAATKNDGHLDMF